MSLSAPPDLPNSPRVWQSLGALLAFGVPWIFGLSQAGAGATFEDDAALLAAYRALPLGFERLISAASVHILGVLPLGGKVLRASVLQSLSLGLFAWLAYQLMLWTVLRDAKSRVTIAAALLAALATALNPLGAVHGATPSGAATAAALGLCGLCVALYPVRSADSRVRLRRRFVLGIIWAATLLESRWCGVALGATLVAGALPRLPKLRLSDAGSFALGCLSVFSLAGGLLFGHFTRLSALGAVFRFSFSSRNPAGTQVERWLALETWLGLAGLMGLALAAIGLLTLLKSARDRQLGTCLLVLLGADLAVPGSSKAVLGSDPAGGVRLLALLALIVLSVACARRLLEWVERLQVPFARAAASGTLLYGVILLLIGMDQTRGGARLREEARAATFTSEALASLPVGSALLLRSEPVWQRLLAAQSLSGQRSDLLVLPMPVIESGAANAEAYAGQNGLLPLIRDMLLAGRPSEYALSALADARPTFVELDPNWEPRLHTHLAPHGFFLAFAPQPLARSERAAEPERVRKGPLRLAAQLRPSGHPRVGQSHADATNGRGAEPVPGSRRVLIDALSRRAMLLASLGDLEPAQQELRVLLDISPDDRASLTLKQRLDRTPKGRVETRDLFALR